MFSKQIMFHWSLVVSRLLIQINWLCWSWGKPVVVFDIRLVVLSLEREMSFWIGWRGHCQMQSSHENNDHQSVVIGGFTESFLDLGKLNWTKQVWTVFNHQAIQHTCGTVARQWVSWAVPNADILDWIETATVTPVCLECCHWHTPKSGTTWFWFSSAPQTLPHFRFRWAGTQPFASTPEEWMEMSSPL